MEGHFRVDKIGARGLKDEAFERAIKEGYIRELLADLPVLQQAGGKNMLYDLCAGWFQQNLMGGDNVGNTYLQTGVDAATLAGICLSYEDREPTYSYDRWYNNTYSYGNMNDWPYNVGNSPYKRFEEDQIEDWTIWQSTDGREAVHFRNKFLYLPTQAYHSTIRSIAILGKYDADNAGNDYYWWRSETGFIRLKDADGNKVTLTKSSNELLLVEYTFTLVSM